MSVTEDTQIHYEVQDHNVAAGYVTYIVEIWRGRRDDPTTDITRYIGVWEDDQLEKNDGEAFDPDWTAAMSGRYAAAPDPKPKIWDILQEVKRADRDATNFRKQQESQLDRGQYRYGESGQRATLYQNFMDAIDVLSDDPDNQSAWEAVDAYRAHEATRYEK